MTHIDSHGMLECPQCEGEGSLLVGMGPDPRQELCPLCDGERRIHYLEALALLCQMHGAHLDAIVRAHTLRPKVVTIERPDPCEDAIYSNHAASAA